MLTFNPTEAAQADRVSSQITETGKYIGVITRAEKLLSKNNVQGLGLSFKADDGSTADYLDLYTINAKGEVLPSMKTAQAILGCLKIKQATDGKIQCEKWSSQERKRETVSVNGYPELMGKRIGLLLQKELSTNTTNGNDVERLQIFGVFQADTELTVSEILARKTTPETLPKMLQALMAKPVRDGRKNKGSSHSSGGNDYGYGDIPPQNSKGEYDDFTF